MRFSYRHNENDRKYNYCFEETILKVTTKGKTFEKLLKSYF